MKERVFESASGGYHLGLDEQTGELIPSFTHICSLEDISLISDENIILLNDDINSHFDEIKSEFEAASKEEDDSGNFLKSFDASGYCFEFSSWTQFAKMIMAIHKRQEQVFSEYDRVKVNEAPVVSASFTKQAIINTLRNIPKDGMFDQEGNNIPQVIINTTDVNLTSEILPGVWNSGLRLSQRKAS